MAARLIIDCDPGHDDAVALILAHAQADVLGITTVSGNAPLTDTTRNALTVTELLGVETAVHAGAARPLVAEAAHAAHVHGPTGLGGIEVVEPARAVASEDAVGYLLEETHRTSEVWLVPIGPLTNIAQALTTDPTLTERIAGISLMGGSATVGNVTPAAEFNVWADPEAADIVFRSGARIRMCGLNLTHQLRTSDPQIEALRALETPVGDFVGALFEFMHDRMVEFVGERTSALHDPCAVLAVTHPELFELEPAAVVVELDGTHTRGMTLLDQRTTRRRGAPNAEVAYRIDAERAMALVMASIERPGRG
jgi:inosine-uridine nucleoside N-ribohydrolase